MFVKRFYHPRRKLLRPLKEDLESISTIPSLPYETKYSEDERKLLNIPPRSIKSPKDIELSLWIEPPKKKSKSRPSTNAENEQPESRNGTTKSPQKNIFDAIMSKTPEKKSKDYSKICIVSDTSVDESSLTVLPDNMIQVSVLDTASKSDTSQVQIVNSPDNEETTVEIEKDIVINVEPAAKSSKQRVKSQKTPTKSVTPRNKSSTAANAPSIVSTDPTPLLPVIIRLIFWINPQI